jgi:hypothetical protein
LSHAALIPTFSGLFRICEMKIEMGENGTWKTVYEIENDLTISRSFRQDLILSRQTSVLLLFFFLFSSPMAQHAPNPISI